MVVHIITEHSEESWESQRDSVEVLLDGKRIAYHPDMQHNKNYGSLKQNTANIVAETLKALGM